MRRVQGAEKSFVRQSGRTGFCALGAGASLCGIRPRLRARLRLSGLRSGWVWRRSWKI